MTSRLRNVSAIFHRRRFLYGAGTLAVIITAVVILWLIWQGRGPRPYGPPRKAFEGSSDSLRQTTIVPTLDTVIPIGKSAIWCSSFQMAWDRLKADVVKGPVRIRNAGPLADQLNRAKQVQDVLEPASYYAAAGFTKDGIVERIQSEMAQRFPVAPTPELNVHPQGAVAYSYLNVRIPFSYPFFENDEDFLFVDPTGNRRAADHLGSARKMTTPIRVCVSKRKSSIVPRRPGGRKRKPMNSC